MSQQEYDNTDRGVLFKNDRKETDNHPDYTGQINVGGCEFWLSAWIKDGRKGKFMSLSVKPKEDAARRTSTPPAPPRQRPKDERYRAGAPAPAPSHGFDDMDDDIPF
jgi:hypothetical protein